MNLDNKPHRLSHLFLVYWVLSVACKVYLLILPPYALFTLRHGTLHHVDAWLLLTTASALLPPFQIHQCHPQSHLPRQFSTRSCARRHWSGRGRRGEWPMECNDNEEGSVQCARLSCRNVEFAWLGAEHGYGGSCHHALRRLPVRPFADWPAQWVSASSNCTNIHLNFRRH